MQTGVLRSDDPAYVWDHYQETALMSTYLLAFVVSDFSYKNAPLVNGSSTQFRIWARRKALNETVLAAKVGPEVLHYFENFFKIDYPLPKMDMIGKIFTFDI